MKDHPIYGWLVYLALAFAAYFAWNGTGEDGIGRSSYPMSTPNL